MKKIIASMLLVSALTAHAQLDDNPLRALEEMQACMSKLDQNYLDKVNQQDAESYNEVIRLCKAGQRDAAQAESQRHSRERVADPEYQKIMQCTGFGNALSDALGKGDFAILDEEGKEVHVCDVFL